MTRRFGFRIDLGSEGDDASRSDLHWERRPGFCPINEPIPVLPADRERWMERGLCCRPDMADTAPWFDPTAYHTARRLCRTCPVQQQCLAFAKRYEQQGEEVFGVWGGQLFPSPDRPIRRRGRRPKEWT